MLLKPGSAFCIRCYVIPISLIAIGAMVWESGSRLREYSDPNWETQFDDANRNAQLVAAFDKDSHGDPKDFAAICADWYAAQAKARTARDDRMDLGTGIIALGVGVSILIATTRTKRLSDLCDVTTPTTPTRFYLLAAIVWLSFGPSEWLWYQYTAGRGDYPPFADVVFIPQAETLIFVVLSLPFVLFGVWIVIHGANLPLAVCSRPVFNRPYTLILTLWGAAVGALALIIYGVVARPYDVPAGVFLFYLLLSGRAAAAGRNLARHPILNR